MSKETHITCDFPWGGGGGGGGSGGPDPERGQGVRTPWKITSYMGFYRV